MGIGAGAAALAVGALGAAGSAFGSYEQANAENKASDDQMKMYQQTRGDLAPYMQGGTAAFSQLQTLLGLNGTNSKQMMQTLQNTPGYQFSLQEGQQGLDRSAAARGMELSGGQLKDTLNYNTGMADNLYTTYANQLMGVSGLGENAAAGLGSQGATEAANAGNFTANGGTAIASGISGVTNQLGAGLYQYGQMGQNNLGTGPGYGPNGMSPGQDPWLDENI